MGIANIGVDQEGVHFGVDVFDHDLEAVETASLGDLNFPAESHNKVLVDNAIRGSKESQDSGNEEALIVV